MEQIFGGIGKLISKHLSGGVLWSYVIIGLVMFGMWGYIQLLESDNRHLKEDLQIAVAESSSKSANIESQSRQVQRKIKAQEEQADVENEIATNPNPVDYFFEWVRDERANSQADNPDSESD